MSDTPLEAASPGDHVTLIRVVVGDLRLRQCDAPRSHRVDQVEEDILQFEATEGQPDQRWEEGEFTMARDERDPVFRAQSLRQTFRGDHAGKAAAQNKHVCHIRLLVSKSERTVERHQCAICKVILSAGAPRRAWWSGWR